MPAKVKPLLAGAGALSTPPPPAAPKGFVAAVEVALAEAGTASTKLPPLCMSGTGVAAGTPNLKPPALGVHEESAPDKQLKLNAPPPCVTEAGATAEPPALSSPVLCSATAEEAPKLKPPAVCADEAGVAVVGAGKLTKLKPPEPCVPAAGAVEELPKLNALVVCASVASLPNEKPVGLGLNEKPGGFVCSCASKRCLLSVRSPLDPPYAPAGGEWRVGRKGSARRRTAMRDQQVYY